MTLQFKQAEICSAHWVQLIELISIYVLLNFINGFSFPIHWLAYIEIKQFEYLSTALLVTSQFDAIPIHQAVFAAAQFVQCQIAIIFFSNFSTCKKANRKINRLSLSFEIRSDTIFLQISLRFVIRNSSRNRCSFKWSGK